MQNVKRLVSWCFISLVAVILFTGCQSGKVSSDKTSAETTTAPAAPAAPAEAAAPAAPVAAAAPAAPAAPAVVAAPAAPAAPAASTPAPPVRIKAGLSTSITDSDGNVWLPDQGFADGETAERPDVQVTNTKSPAIYQSERYSMTAFTYPVPNGKYIVKLHFAETYDGISGPGERVFSFKVGDQEFKDFDVFVKAGGAKAAYVETVNLEVTDGKVNVTFTPNVENPEINGIEILPAP